jgi:ribonuclease Z
MKIKLVFLGTGQAVPTAKRNHTSILLSYANENILFDCGEGTQRQFRKAKINPCKTTRLFITHWHGDHILGIPGLLQTLALNGYNRTLYVYGPRGTKRYLEMILGMFIFVGKIKTEVKEIEQGKVLETNEFYVESMPMTHGAPCNAYSFVEKEKLRIDKAKMKKLKLPQTSIIRELKEGKDIEFNGKKIKSKDVTYKEEGRKITFIFDTKINPAAIELAKDSDLLISESTYIEKDADKAEEYTHLTSSQAAEIAKKSKSKKLVLSHISQRYANEEEIILQEAKKIFKNVILAEDLMKMEI